MTGNDEIKNINRYDFEEILRAFRIGAFECPDYESLEDHEKENIYYVMGKAPVNFPAQQKRALNLAWALNEQWRKKDSDSGDGSGGPERKVAIVGGGLAGMTAAVALHILNPKLKITLFEGQSELFQLQRGTHHRYIHPTAFDWPDREVGHESYITGLPCLNWAAGPASKVAATVLRQFEEYRNIFHIQEMEEALEAKGIESIEASEVMKISSQIMGILQEAPALEKENLRETINERLAEVLKPVNNLEDFSEGLQAYNRMERVTRLEVKTGSLVSDVGKKRCSRYEIASSKWAFSVIKEYLDAMQDLLAGLIAWDSSSTDVVRKKFNDREAEAKELSREDQPRFTRDELKLDDIVAIEREIYELGSREQTNHPASANVNYLHAWWHLKKSNQRRERLQDANNTEKIPLFVESHDDAATIHHFDSVILTVGLGYEKRDEDSPGVPFLSYWENDPFSQPTISTGLNHKAYLEKRATGTVDNKIFRHRLLTNKRFLVKGAGDGGLADVFRLRIKDYDHEDFLETIFAGNLVGMGTLKDLYLHNKDKSFFDLVGVFRESQSVQNLMRQKKLHPVGSVEAKANVFGYLDSLRRTDTTVDLGIKRSGMDPYEGPPDPFQFRSFALNRLLFLLIYLNERDWEDSRAENRRMERGRLRLLDSDDLKYEGTDDEDSFSFRYRLEIDGEKRETKNYQNVIIRIGAHNPVKYLFSPPGDKWDDRKEYVSSFKGIQDTAGEELREEWSDLPLSSVTRAFLKKQKEQVCQEHAIRVMPMFQKHVVMTLRSEFNMQEIESAGIEVRWDDENMACYGFEKEDYFEAYKERNPAMLKGGKLYFRSIEVRGPTDESQAHGG